MNEKNTIYRIVCLTSVPEMSDVFIVCQPISENLWPSMAYTELNVAFGYNKWGCKVGAVVAFIKLLTD